MWNSSRLTDYMNINLKKERRKTKKTKNALTEGGTQEKKYSPYIFVYAQNK